VSLLEIALTFFLVANPFGNSPAIIALIKDFDFERQKRIMLTEALLALLLALFFQYLGKIFLDQLSICCYSMRIAGGVLLLLVALDMIFSPITENSKGPLKREPLFVPIATPLITGPALLTIIMVYSAQEKNPLKITAALGITWIGVTGSLLLAPYLNKVLKKRGLTVLAQLMGLFLTMMAVGMVVQGLTDFFHSRNTKTNILTEQPSSRD
jgi:multiple antibiotic resistance protein